MNENGQSGTAEGAKRHSRRRRRSSRGQGKAGQQDQSRAKAAQDKRPQSKGSQGRNAQGKNPQGKNAQAKNSHNKNGSPKNQQKGSQGKGGSAARPGSRPGSRRGSRSGGGRGPQRAASGAARRSPARGFSGREELADLPTSIETSAGGLVLSGLAEAVQPDGSVDLSSIYVALIGRLDRRGRLLWSMPKGHIEPDESQHTTAEREVWEETGIAGEVIADLGTIDYWFISDGVQIHKTVHHHLLRFVDGDLNDEDPEVTEVSWLPVNQLMEKLAYADERRLARIAFDRLPEYARKEARAGRSTPR